MHHTFQVLGRVQVIGAYGDVVPVGGPKQRTLLLALLLHLNRPVGLDWLTDAVWEEEAPASARANLRSYVNGLRRALSGFDDVEIVGRGRSYELLVTSERLDLTRFEKVAQDGRAALLRGDASTAAARLGEAIGLWRGPAGQITGVGTCLAARLDALRERYMVVVEDHAEAVLALGPCADTVFRLRVLLGEEPFRERSWGLLMRALYACGDTAGALRAYAHARERLAGELGIEPGEELRSIHRAILNRDPAIGSATSCELSGSRPSPPLRGISSALPVSGAVRSHSRHVACPPLSAGLWTAGGGGL